jgi:PASTA domain
MRRSLIPRLVLVGLVAALIPAVAWGRGADDTGIVNLCSVSGARTATGVLTFTLVTVASAGGTTTLNVPAGTCAAKLYYPAGVSVTVTQSPSAGNAVTGISIGATKGGPGTTTVISANNPKAGSAVITIGTGEATLTFVTNGPTGAARPCKVPNVYGLTLAAAKTALRKANCTVGVVHKAYSNLYYPDRVYSQSPPRGTVLGAHGAVSLTVSLGHH